MMADLLSANSDLRAPVMTLMRLSKVDASPLPNYKGDFVSIGAVGTWRHPAGKNRFLKAGTVQEKPPAANCSPPSIIYYAERAPEKFEYEKSGKLYGVKTHTPATRVDNMPGFNSCALVVHAILKKAGCKWAKKTANAKEIYDMGYRAGWRPSDVQKAGCIVAWNSRWEGKRTRIGKGILQSENKKKGVLFRHVGITTGSWMAVDNSGITSRPSAYITTRPIRYEKPLFLCPPENDDVGLPPRKRMGGVRSKTRSK